MAGIVGVRGRDALLALSLALVCFVLSGCAEPGAERNDGGEEMSTLRNEPHLPSAEADILGTVTEVVKLPHEGSSDEGTAERIGSVLLEEEPDEESGSQKDSVSVTKATKLFERHGQDLTPVAFDHLNVGQRARAWYTGPVAESYPRQATAKVIVVHPPAE